MILRMDGQPRYVRSAIYFGLLLIVMLSACLLFYWWVAPVETERFLRLRPSWTERIPQQWKAITLNVDEGSGDIVGIYHWPLGTVEQNPLGFWLSFAAFVVLVIVLAHEHRRLTRTAQ